MGASLDGSVAFDLYRQLWHLHFSLYATLTPGIPPLHFPLAVADTSTVRLGFRMHRNGSRWWWPIPLRSPSAFMA